MEGNEYKAEKKNLQTVYGLIFKSGRAVQLVNLITLYRIVTSPLLLLLAISGQMEIFKWLLLVSFLTDAADGYLARKYKATSILGAQLDSIGDDLTMLVSVIALFVTRMDFIQKEWIVIVLLLGLFFVQTAYAVVKYKKATSFHTRMAKAAAFFQGVFFLSVFFLDTVFYPLFYFSAIVTGLELIEEIVLVYRLPEWRNDVKGLFWIKKKNPGK